MSITPTGPANIVLLARRTDIRMISLDTSDHSDLVLPLANVRNAVDIDYDPVDRHVYWTDDDRKAVLRARLDGSGGCSRGRGLDSGLRAFFCSV